MINQSIAYILISIGLAFDFLGVLGLIRLPDLYNRLQAAAKCVTFGTAVIFLGVFLYFGLNSTGFKALLGFGLILATAPVAIHAIARAAHRNGIAVAKEPVIDQYAETYSARVSAQDHPLKEESK